MKAVTLIPIAGSTKYGCHPHHRNGNPNKSQWTITEHDEVASFKLAHTNGWCSSTTGWGLHVSQKRAEYLGTSEGGVRILFIAKFVAADSDSWHGYPADPQAKVDDVPENRVLQHWLTHQFLAPSKVRKIIKRQPCSL